MKLNDTRDLQEFFDSLNSTYDNIHDVYYSHIFNEIAVTINSLNDSRGERALDIGCGTGIQSFQLYRKGYTTTGIDISEKLIQIAEEKKSYFLDPKIGADLPKFSFGNAMELNEPAQTYILVNCCGSVLNFCDNHIKCLEGIKYCLKSNGKLVIEFETFFNLHLIMAFLSKLFKMNSKSYGNVNLRAIIKHVVTKHRFHYKSVHGSTLFSPTLIYKELKTYGFEIEEKKKINILTPLIPINLATKNHPSSIVKILFQFLTFLDKNIFFIFPASNHITILKKIES